MPVDPLIRWFTALDRTVVCLSGGIDSSVLAAAAARSGRPALAATGTSPSLAEADLAACRDLCRHVGLAHFEVTTHELERADYAANPVDRCFFCKSELFDRIHAALPADWQGAVLVEGTQTDDLGGHRPGLSAARGAGVRSPFLELGWGKAAVRAAADALGLPANVRDRPSSPCLASRLPFGTPVTAERLSAVEQAERELHRRGYVRSRVRHHDLIARIELPLDEIAGFVAHDAAAVAAALRSLGFVYTTVDVLGLRSGSLHEALATRPGGVHT
ncbi:MAG: ATP-dependent sacrificial sulfur transferase LarE [Myxococcales bacterium]|nr:ATP-dependent sacrificial sulfur transferase LarE [Myxococcales bacterium]